MEFDGDVLVAVGAFLTAVGGAAMGWAAVVAARHKGEKDCEQKLQALRAENVALHDELYERKMKP